MAKESAVYAEVDEELMKWLEDDTMEQDKDPGAAAAEIRDAFEELLESYNEEPVNIVGKLPEDDAILQEMADRKAAVIRLKKEKPEKAEMERVYTDYMDSYFKAAKVINPLGGFGKARLVKALEILRIFEDKYWPLVTKITRNNIKPFKDLIPDEHYDDIMVGRKRALGAIRMKDGKRCCVGVAVYHIEVQSITMVQVIRLDWIYVARNFREQGVANMLMAELAGLALQDDEAFISVSINISDNSDSGMQAESEALESFLRSWNYKLRVDTGRIFYINLENLKDNKYLKERPEGVRSLNELGLSGREMLRKFFRKRNRDYDKTMGDFVYEHYDFFDPDVSCALVADGAVTAVFLVHRYSNGYYRYEVMRYSRNTDPAVFLQLLRFSYQSAMKKGKGKGTFFGAFESAEGFITIAKLIPDTLIITQLTGTLMPPGSRETVSSADWDRLRKEAGYDSGTAV